MIVDIATGTKSGTIFTPEQVMFIKAGDNFFCAPEYLASEGNGPRLGDMLKLLVTGPPEVKHGPNGKKVMPGPTIVEGLFQVEAVIHVNEGVLSDKGNPFSGLPSNLVNGGAHFALIVEKCADNVTPLKGLRTEKAKLVS